MTFIHSDDFYRHEAAAIAREQAAKGTNGHGRRGPSTPNPAPSRHVHLTPANQIVIRPTRWLWQDRLPLGSLALVGGREGIGKSILIDTIAADLTRGRLPGVYAGTPKAVIVAATEDSWEHTIVPRFMAAQADLTRVFRVAVTTAAGSDTGLSLPQDLRALEQQVTDADVALVILDPLMSRLESGLDSHKDADVRLALEPLVALADRSAATVAGLIHVNKSSSNDALTTLMGSRAFAAVARSVLFVMTDPDDDHTRLLGQAKNNLGRADLPTLKFTIAGAKVADTVEGPVWTGQLAWAGETDRSIRDALEATAEASGDKSATSEAADWLTDYLTSKGGSADSADIRTEGVKVGHAKNTLFRAKDKLKIVSISSGFPRRAFWHLPTSQYSQPSGETLSNGNNGNNGNTAANCTIPSVPTVPSIPSLPGHGTTEPLDRDAAWARSDDLFKQGWH